MLEYIEDLGHRIGCFVSGYNFDSKIVDSVNNFISEFYPESALDPLNITDNVDMTMLRQEVCARYPALFELSSEISTLLENKYSAIIVKNSKLVQFDVDARRRLLFCLSLTIGWPTPTDKVNRRIIWDVKSRLLPSGHISTFSENSYEAQLHTDTQYFPHPERYTLLYFVKPATEGGVSLIRDGRHIVESLLEASQGEWVFDFLSKTKLPFRIPTSYTKERKQETVETTFAPIFSDRPLIRYRKDTLEAGLKANPAYDNAETRLALYILENVIGDKRWVTTAKLEEDDLLITNNHEGLHGRTEFADQDRHLIRIRMADRSEAELNNGA